MSKLSCFKALGEESRGSESDEDGPRNKPTREALEEEATAAYNEALQFISSSDIEKVQCGVEALEALLDSSYLNDDRENWSLAHRQQQMRMGCLKILSQTYLEILNKPKLAEPLLLEALEMDPDNVLLWIRLGSVTSKLINYKKAYHAFSRGLQCSPHNWICIESLVTLSYVMLDWPQCLYYCAVGLEKDSNFIRGMVFRDEILGLHPYMGNLDFLSDYQTCLQLRGGYDDSWKHKFFEEVNMLKKREEDHLDQVRKEDEQERSQSLYCTTRMKSLTFVELAQTIFDFRDQVMRSGTLLRPIDMSGCTKEYDSELDEDDQGQKSDNLTDEATRCSVFRSRSASDDKETVVTACMEKETTTENPTGEEAAVVRDKENTDSQQKAGGEEECSQSQVDTEVESTPKKKRGKDAKWWQYEGKRRSQRVRGHLMPSTQSQSKNSQQRGFEESLKNLIPTSLLCASGIDDVVGNEFELGENTVAVDPDGNYFGTQAEFNDVKNFVAMYGKRSIGEVASQLTLFLSKLSNHTWPAELVPAYLRLCQLHRDRVKELSEWTEDEELLENLKEDAVINLSILEFLLDSISSSEIELLKSDVKFMSKMFYLDTVCAHGLRNDVCFNIRANWFRMKYGITLSNVGLGSYKDPLHYLKEIQQLLVQQQQKPDEKDRKENNPITIKIPTKIDNTINAEEVRKKIRFVQKMESINQINDLYQGRNYESLIDILSFCLTSEDYGGADLVNRYYLAESYYHVGKFTECVEQIVKIINPCTKSRMDQILCKCLNLLEKLCMGEEESSCSSSPRGDNLSKLQMREKRSLTNAMVQVLTSNENRQSNIPETVVITPWCILHSILFNLETQEPVLYLEDGEMVPHSIVLLQFAHEFLNRSNKCTLDNGKMLTYTIKCLYPIRGSDEYGSFDETKHCIEQAIFCLYSHPSKKSKLKYLNEHSTQGIPLEWPKCLQLYDYYNPEKLPEFDSYDSISADVEGLLQRILAVMPEELKPSLENYEKMKLVLEGAATNGMEVDDAGEEVSSTKLDFPTECSNIYYLLGDHYFKNKEWIKAVEYYTYDLTVTPSRFDSWAAIALAKGEMINSKLNACENYKLEEVITNANVVVNCFRHALDLEPDNSKIRIEFGSFAYAMHSFCSRLLKQGMEQQQLSLDTFGMVERKKGEFLKSASKCFEPVVKNYHPGNCSPDDDQHDELWIHHYMLGKVMEKLHPSDVEKFLTQYETAGNRIHEQGAPYPAKINFWNPPELAVEALEIYYRIHASILGYIDKHDYDEEKDKIFCAFVERAAASPFIKRKANRGGGMDASEQRKRKATEDAKKEQAEIEGLMQEILDKVETMVTKMTDEEQDEESSTTSSQVTTLSGSSDDELSTDYDASAEPNPVPASLPMQSFGLAAFCEQMRKKENQSIVKVPESSAVTASTSPSSSTALVAPTTKPVDILKQDVPTKPSSTNLPPISTPTTFTIEDNRFYKDFVDVKYGKVVSRCLAALEECILRFPQHHKSYYRIVNAYFTLAKDKLQVCREYFIGNPSSDKKRICGLFFERKATNFFNGVWRNPIDDIDRPGSFPYHMSRTIQSFLEILDKLNDHQSLAEVGIALAKIPDHDKQYLYNFERQQFSQHALTCCAGAAKRFFSQVGDLQTGVISIFETYQKLQKFNSKENVLASVLLACYQIYRQQFGMTEEATLEQAFRFFQQVTWASKTNPGNYSNAGSAMQKNAGPTIQKNTGSTIQKNTGPIVQKNSGSTGVSVGMKRKKDTVGRLSSSRPNSSPYNAQMTALSNPMTHKQNVVEQTKTSTPIPPPAAHVQSSRPNALPYQAQATVLSNPMTHKQTLEQTKTSTPIPPPVAHVQSSRTNTSPYKTQTTMLSNPMSHKQSVVEQSKASIPPPAAHVQSSRRISSDCGNEGDNDAHEIIDLTTKTPSPQKESVTAAASRSDAFLVDAPTASNTSRFQSSQSLYFIPPNTFTSNTPSYPLPPKKKRVMMEQAKAASVVVEKSGQVSDSSEDMDCIIIDDP